MIKKIILKGSFDDQEIKDSNLIYWLKQKPNKRLDAVEFLRRQQHGSSERLQRVYRVIEQTQS